MWGGHVTGPVSNSESGPPPRARLVRRTQGRLGLSVLQFRDWPATRKERTTIRGLCSLER